MLLARRSPLLRDFSARFLDWVNNKSKLRQASKDYMSHTGNLEIQAYWHAVRNAVGYNIYRGTVAGGPYSMINSSLDGTTAYTDNTVVSGQTYYYVATAVDGSSNESGYSNQAQAVIPNP